MFMRLKYSLLFINETGVTGRTLSWTTSDNYHRNPLTSVKHFWPENEFKPLSIYVLLNTICYKRENYLLEYLHKPSFSHLLTSENPQYFLLSHRGSGGCCPPAISPPLMKFELQQRLGSDCSPKKMPLLIRQVMLLLRNESQICSALTWGHSLHSQIKSPLKSSSTRRAADPSPADEFPDF